MASRKEEKERARQQRLEAERAAAVKAARARRTRLAGGGLLAVAIVAGVVVAIASGGGGSSTSSVTAPAASGVKLPASRITSLAAAAKAAGCATIDIPASVALAGQNRQHVDPGTRVTYATNPPSYGSHYPGPASDGYDSPGHTPAVGFLVHAMEHGRVEYQYRPGLPASDVKELQALFNEPEGQWSSGQLLLLFQNQTSMPYDVAATAWGHVLGCKTFNTRVFDALRDFRLAYTNKGPENLGTGRE